MKESHLEVDCLSRALAATREPCTTLGTAVNDVCTLPSLRDTFRALFAAEVLSCSVGWPRHVGAERARDWLRDGDISIELARSLPRAGFELGIVLSAATAVHLSDRLLGAASSSGMASRGGAPSEAECGVLAYAAARLAASHRGGWLVRDVRPASVVGEEVVLWPVAVDSSIGKLELTLFLSRALADVLPEVELHALVHEQMGPDDALPSLVAGDVWVSDQLLLTSTSQGLTGSLLLRVPGCEQLLPARLAEHHVQLTQAGSRSVVGPGQVELLLAERAIGFLALAALGGGARCFVGEVGRQSVCLRCAGQTVARGELVVWRGALGMRIAGP